MELYDALDGSYKFVTGIAPYSAGVIAASGYKIIHATLRVSLPYQQGFDLIDQHLSGQGRSRKALCAIELRIPAPLPFDGFVNFNADYRALLTEWGLLVEGQNPIARTNVAPNLSPPPEPSLYAFSYTVPADDNSRKTFVVAGAGDLHDQGQMSPDAIVRPDETTAEALEEKATVVMGEIQARMDALGATWSYATSIGVYTIHPLHTFLASVVLENVGSAASHGVNWHLAHPPILGLAYEMDVRGVRKEIRVG